MSRRTNPCPACGEKTKEERNQDAAVAINLVTGSARAVMVEREPEPGEYSICHSCGAICIVTDALGLREVALKEIVVLRVANPKLCASLLKLSAQCKFKPKNN